MNARLDHTPIRYPDVIAPINRIPAPTPQHLDEPRAQPDEAGQDDLGEWAVLNADKLRPAKPANPDDVFSQDEDADEALANAVSDADTLQALSWLHKNKVLPDHVWHVINEASMAMAEKRLNGSRA